MIVLWNCTIFNFQEMLDANINCISVPYQKDYKKENLYYPGIWHMNLHVAYLEKTSKYSRGRVPWHFLVSK